MLEQIQNILKTSNKYKLSEESGVSRSYLYRLARGHTVPSFSLVVKLLKCLGYKLEIKKD